jgi:predicted nucleic acid-binding protein
VIVVDSGQLYAAADNSDQHHSISAALFEHPPEPPSSRSAL